MDPILTQGAGGNVSVKQDATKMIIKASGVTLKDVRETGGWVEVDYSGLDGALKAGPDGIRLEGARDDELATFIDHQTTTLVPGAKASIETAMHAVCSRYVVHIHPARLNVFLCAVEGRVLCEEILTGVEFVWIEPTPPGYYLARAIQDSLKKYSGKEPAVILLASHGVIVHSDSMEAIHKTYDVIFGRMDAWLESKKALRAMPIDETWREEVNKPDIFPDTVVFKQLSAAINSLAPAKARGIIETYAASKYTRSLMEGLGLTPRTLSSHLCSYILGMGREKHRQSMFKPEIKLD
ncbi:MAG: class II aldolase/adducin family protein [Proteobacteria bacterium]|nr:class II aldolase/adducin family protein [Pseudomonadota bacterium]